MCIRYTTKILSEPHPCERCGQHTCMEVDIRITYHNEKATDQRTVVCLCGQCKEIICSEHNARHVAGH